MSEKYRPRQDDVDRKQILDAFFRRQMQVSDRYVAVRYRENNRIDYDCALIRRYLFPQAKVLDLGCGTGLIEERIASEAALIHAVDQYPQFIERAVPFDNVTYIQGHAAEFFRRELQYDLIICFGVVCYLSDQEMIQMLRHCIGMLAPRGSIIIKGQWGLEERKIIHKFSEELGAMYYADYRQVDEMRLLCESLGTAVEVVDLYPPELNRWPDTHDYAFVLKMAGQP